MRDGLKAQLSGNSDEWSTPKYLLSQIQQEFGKIDFDPCPLMGDDKMDNRLIKSQNQLREVMAEALGIYMAKEPKIGDQWQTESLFKVVKHAEHEFGEILRSKTADRQYHNTLDLIAQMAIVAVKIREGKLR